jgi:Protein of unknown function (DUF5132)
MAAEVLRGARRGVGWGLGVGVVLAAGSVVRNGHRDTVRATMKTVIKVREASAEAGEHLQDLYAEAASERTVERTTSIVAEAARERAAQVAG